MISVAHLTKQYGSFTAVHDLSFTIEDGHVYGFLGPNGAGKSTTMNMMTGCLSPTEGTISIDGHDMLTEPLTAKRLIGYLPELPPLYMNETPREYLCFVGEAKGLKGEALREQVDSVIEKTRIESVQDQLIGKLSKGYRQRVGIAQALLGNPKVIILDEPTVGLDPLQIIEIRDLIRQLGESHTVIFSSHILSEVQAICDRVLIISQGELVAFDETQKLEIANTSGKRISFTTTAAPEEAEIILSAVAGLKAYRCSASNGKTAVEAELSEGSDEAELSNRLFFAFAQKERAIFDLAAHKTDLEDVFLHLTEKPAENSAAEEKVEEVTEA